MADHRPIVFAKTDLRNGKEALILIFRADRSSTASEAQLRIPLRDLDAEAPSALQDAADVGCRVLEGAREAESGPIELLTIESDSGADLSERLKPWL